MKRFGSRKGFTIIDALITLCMIGVLIGVVIPKYQQLAREAQKTALKAELANIRTSISLFKLLNRRNPEGLKELIEKNVMLPVSVGNTYTGSVFKEKYLLPNAMDQQGNIIDPFGNRFLYDPVRGEVKTTTQGYQDW